MRRGLVSLLHIIIFQCCPRSLRSRWKNHQWINGQCHIIQKWRSFPKNNLKNLENSRRYYRCRLFWNRNSCHSCCQEACRRTSSRFDLQEWILCYFIAQFKLFNFFFREIIFDFKKKSLTRKKRISRTAIFFTKDQYSIYLVFLPIFTFFLRTSNIFQPATAYILSFLDQCFY